MHTGPLPWCSTPGGCVSTRVRRRVFTRARTRGFHTCTSAEATVFLSASARMHAHIAGILHKFMLCCVGCMPVCTRSHVNLQVERVCVLDVVGWPCPKSEDADAGKCAACGAGVVGTGARQGARQRLPLPPRPCIAAAPRLAAHLG